MPGLGPGDRRCKSCRADQLFQCGVVGAECGMAASRHACDSRSSFVLAFRTQHLILLSGIRVVHPPVKRNGVGAIPT